MLDDQEILDAARRLTRAARSPARVILFGSYARGEADARSDVDLLVVEDALEDKAGEYIRLRDALGTLPTGVDLLLLSRAEYDRRSQVKGTMPFRARTEGRLLHDTTA